MLPPAVLPPAVLPASEALASQALASQAMAAHGIVAQTLTRPGLAHGIDPDFVEATLIAWLAREFIAGRPIDTPSITGARHPVRLGALWPAPLP